jgi:hexosaminidase
VNPGSNFYEKVDNAFCPGNEKTFEFIDKVFSEVAPLFPSEYVHIGGDECFKGFWKTCAKCQRRMADEHLANVPTNCRATWSAAPKRSWHPRARS